MIKKLKEKIRIEMAKQIREDYDENELATKLMIIDDHALLIDNVNEIMSDMKEFKMDISSAVEKTLDDVIDEYL